VSGAFALQPELVPRAAVEGGEARFHGLVEGLLVHKADHENTPAGRILDDGGDEPIEFAEIKLHAFENPYLHGKGPPAERRA
jgi:hypothetical protein